MLKRIFIAVALLLVGSGSIFAQKQKVQNLPYYDNRRWHFGFSVGTHIQDLTVFSSGYTTPEGESWFVEVPDFNPGFNVSLMADLYLCPHLNLRLSPGMFFGNKVLTLRDHTNGTRHTQDIKSYYVTLPLDLKFSAKRINNYRPYLMGGVMGVADIAKKKSPMLKLNTFDCYLTVSIGCDFYLPYFKLNPELKFSFGLTDLLQHKRPDLREPGELKFTESVSKVRSNMIVLSFYFE